MELTPVEAFEYKGWYITIFHSDRLWNGKAFEESYRATIWDDLGQVRYWYLHSKRDTVIAWCKNYINTLDSPKTGARLQEFQMVRDLIKESGKGYEVD